MPLWLVIAAFLSALPATWAQQQDSCAAAAGTFSSTRVCLQDTLATLTAFPAGDMNVPPGYRVGYVLTTGDSLVIREVKNTPEFTVVNPSGLYTIHTLVFDPATLDLTTVQPGVTTGTAVNALLVQGGGAICGALDVNGAAFRFECGAPPCIADAGSLVPQSSVCGVGETTLTAGIEQNAVVPLGFDLLYVLTSGDSLVIEAVGSTPEFTVDTTGRFTIHTLVYDSTTLSLDSIVIGQTTGSDINALLIQGGGAICGALDVAGAAFDVEECICGAEPGVLAGGRDICIDSTGQVTLTATEEEAPVVPGGFQVVYVLTATDSLVIQAVSPTPEFTVDTTGRFTIHTLVYDPATLSLDSIQVGVTSGFDVDALLIQGGGGICGALDVPGAVFMVMQCDCSASAGSLAGGGEACLDNGQATLTATIAEAPVLPDSSYQVIYVLTAGDSLVIQAVGATPEFTVDTTGLFTIHTLVVDTAGINLDSIAVGVTTGFDVNALLIQGGGTICGALDVAGAAFNVSDCQCTASAGSLTGRFACFENGQATLSAEVDAAPVVPDSFQVVYVLTAGDSLVIQAVSPTPEFIVDTTGRFVIHTLVYNPATLNLDSVQIGVTTGFEVNALLLQGGGEICAALDVTGARFNVAACPDGGGGPCAVTGGGLLPVPTPLNPYLPLELCMDGQTSVNLKARQSSFPLAPEGFKVAYVLTKGDDLVIQAVSQQADFTVNTVGSYRIHTLVYHPDSLDLSTIEPGVTTGGDVVGLLTQGGGAVCGALDVEGAAFTVKNCQACDAEAGHLVTRYETCLPAMGKARLEGVFETMANVPIGYEQVYVLTTGEDQVIQKIAYRPDFFVESEGRYTIHSLVYDPNTLDLRIIQPGVTTAADINALLVQGGSGICASLDLTGARFDLKRCYHYFVAYPNPIQQTMTVEMTGEDDAVEVRSGVSSYVMEVVNIQGTVVARYTLAGGASRQNVDMSALPAGLYTLRVLRNGVPLQTQRITKVDE